MQGNYSSPTQRYALSNATASNYFIKLRSFFNETNLPILSDAHYFLEILEIVAIQHYSVLNLIMVHMKIYH